MFSGIQKGSDPPVFPPLDMLPVRLHTQTDGVLGCECVYVFLNLYTEGKPTIRYCLKLNAASEYEMWWNVEVVNSNYIDNAPALLNSCSMIETRINCLSNLKERNVTDDETLFEIIDSC